MVKNNFSLCFYELLDLYREAPKLKRKKYTLELSFELDSDSVNSAWLDTSELIADSFTKVILKNECEKNQKQYLYQVYKLNNKCLDLSKDIDLEDFFEYINHSNTSNKHNHSLLELNQKYE